MSIIKHTIFGHNSATLWPIGLKYVMGAQKIIIYRLVKRNVSFYVDAPFF